MRSAAIAEIRQQLEELERKMKDATKSFDFLFNKVHPQQQQAAILLQTAEYCKDFSE